MGAASYSAAVRVGGSGCESGEWASESSVQCRASAGGRGSLALAVSVGSQPGTRTVAVSYDSASMSSAGQLNAAPSGGSTQLTMVGTGYGSADASTAVRVGGSACGGSGGGWSSDSAVVCVCVCVCV